jgi:hypothetical protein
MQEQLPSAYLFNIKTTINIMVRTAYPTQKRN